MRYNKSITPSLVGPPPLTQAEYWRDYDIIRGRCAAIRLIRRSVHMRLAIALLFLIYHASGQSVVAEPDRTVQVRSYVRKDGTVVAAYTRAAPGTGTASRSTSARRAFQAQQPCPSTTARTGPCPGCVADHVEASACGGIDAPENMQWQSVSEAKAKDKWERDDCERPATIPRVALPF
jgi:hypothetical protein